ncbi:helix-turn-helix domain-containing protein [Chitinimonas lacunae]|uniref:Helix-turn-helix domain-containing protein n=1 Tax=Chitinimonas lacunae TaxID=1963018 RepID=A0ABV8MQL9_9NEIS
MNHYLNRIQRSLDHIEAHLDQPLRLETLAALACYSPWHFHRVFLGLVGLPAMDYVRKRRLLRAARLLVESERPIIEIALDHGFQSPEVFLRAFRRLFGLTPSAYRQRGRLPPSSGPARLSPYPYHPYLGGLTMQARIVERPAMSLIGYALRTNIHEQQHEQEISRFWQDYLGSERERRLREVSIADHEYGVCSDFDPAKGDLSYSIAVEADPAASVPAGAQRHDWPAVSCAVFSVPPVTDPSEFSGAIQQTWKMIMEQWFPQSGYVPAEDAQCERYDFGNAMEVEIWVPIRQAD